MVPLHRLRERFYLTCLTATKLKTLRSQNYRVAIHHADLLAVSLLVALTVFAEWDLLLGRTVVGTDAVTQFIPWYSFLGEQLRSGNVPGWNPYQVSGAPFAADPLSGWTYLPAMLFFALLPLAPAVKAYLFFHPLLAGLGLYALARVLRINVAGALLAAVAYEYVGYVYVRNVCCFAYVSVLAWLPFAILGAELAIRSESWLRRGLWWALSGLAISQILAAWLGQGAYYALFALGGYVAYRTLLFPPENIRGLWARLSGAVLHGGAVLAFGFGLAAAGILPRLEYNALSNLAGGYPDEDSGFGGGWTIADWENLFVSPSFFYVGALALALALVAPLLVRGRPAAYRTVPYFVVLTLFALTLSGTAYTPIHSLLYLLPNFESLQPHYPQRSMLIFYLGAALLAGAAVSILGRLERRETHLLVLPVLAAIFLVTRSTLEPPIELPEEFEDPGLWEAPMPFLMQNGVAILPGSLLALTLALLFLTIYSLLPNRFLILRGLAATLLVLVVFADLYSVGKTTLEENTENRGPDRIAKVDLDAYYAPTNATRLLRRDGEVGETSSRFFAYAPGLRYQRYFAEPEIRALEAEGRPTALRLQSIQTYHAVQLGRYVEYLETMNGEGQNYHSANVLPEGLDSPLLDLLNARHVVTLTDRSAPDDLSGPDAELLENMKDAYPTVYEDDQVEGAGAPRCFAAGLDRPLRPAVGTERNTANAEQRRNKPQRNGFVRRRASTRLGRPERCLRRPGLGCILRARPDRTRRFCGGVGPAGPQRDLLPGLESLRGRRARLALPDQLSVPGRADSRGGSHRRTALRVYVLAFGNSDLIFHRSGMRLATGSRCHETSAGEHEIRN